MNVAWGMLFMNIVIYVYCYHCESWMNCIHTHIEVHKSPLKCLLNFSQISSFKFLAVNQRILMDLENEKNVLRKRFYEIIIYIMIKIQ